jgi:hypothetical protein
MLPICATFPLIYVIFFCCSHCMSKKKTHANLNKKKEIGLRHLVLRPKKLGNRRGKTRHPTFNQVFSNSKYYYYYKSFSNSKFLINKNFWCLFSKFLIFTCVCFVISARVQSYGCNNKYVLMEAMSFLVISRDFNPIFLRCCFYFF